MAADCGGGPAKNHAKKVGWREGVRSGLTWDARGQGLAPMATLAPSRNPSSQNPAPLRGLLMLPGLLLLLFLTTACPVRESVGVALPEGDVGQVQPQAPEPQPLPPDPTPAADTPHPQETPPPIDAPAPNEPLGLFLTWRQDPTTTMVIDWHTLAGVEADPPLRYRQRGLDDWTEVRAETSEFPFSDREIHRVELTGLSPDTAYDFRVFEDGRTYYFRTLPGTAQEPVRFITGGDTLHRREWMEATNRAAMQYDPDFIVWGGDLAYADGLEDRVERWYTWFEVNLQTLIADDGRVVPIVVAIGNHEVRGGFFMGGDRGREAYEDTLEYRRAMAPYFFSLFAFPHPQAYGVLDVGDYLSLIILDTHHATPVEGTQTEWLETTLREREGRPHLIPVYHVPAFPSHRDYNHYFSSSIREHWLPLFERYGVELAFENHDHTYKRTAPIRGGEIRSDGILYVGDGAWGVGTRPVHDVEQTWYLDRAKPIHHGIVVTLQGTHRHLLVFDAEGNIIDEYPQTPRPR
ncbi:MAG: metallophosphoesterase family protein [Puniceicoccaceae bacterium]|nr:MAG: metallophosphoesterase family protein [Puniceicoccaceae bacterium]